MKKLGVLFCAALLVVAFTVPASAIESQFGGYFRTRAWMQENWSGNDRDEALDLYNVDSRARLYYTALFHENLKFVSKFEIDAQWGSLPGGGYDANGQIGTDGEGVEVKNVYMDFNTGPVNWKAGLQGTTIARGFIFSDDFAGLVITYKGDGFSIPFKWIKAYEGGIGLNANDFDVDYYAIDPTFTIGDMLTLNPYFMWVYSKDASAYARGPFAVSEEINLYYLGVDADVNFGMGSAWLTGIYEGGDLDPLGGGDSVDVSAWLLGFGGAVNLGMLDVHGEFFYATGDDNPNDTDWDQFWVPKGQSYYWAEIMGYGMFDWWTSNNSPADQIGNIWAANLGTTVKPMDKLSIKFDLWYASLAEDVVTLNGDTESDLGLEADLKLTYEIVQNLNLDLVGAYLFAGDATTNNDTDDANPYLLGTQLSLSW
jgi:hypothetical protein